MRPCWRHRNFAVRHRFVLVDQWYTRNNRGARCKESAGVHPCRPPYAAEGGGQARGRTTPWARSVTNTTTKSTNAFPTPDIRTRTTQRGPDRGAPVNLPGTALPPQRETLHMDNFRRKAAESASSDANPLCDRLGSKKRRHQLPRDCHGHSRVAGVAETCDSRTNLVTRPVDHGKCEATEAAMVRAVKERPCGQRSTSSRLLPLVLVLA